MTDFCLHRLFVAEYHDELDAVTTLAFCREMERSLDKLSSLEEACLAYLAKDKEVVQSSSRYNIEHRLTTLWRNYSTCTRVHRKTVYTVLFNLKDQRSRETHSYSKLTCFWRLHLSWSSTFFSWIDFIHRTLWHKWRRDHSCRCLRRCEASLENSQFSSSRNSLKQVILMAVVSTRNHSTVRIARTCGK